MTTAEMAPAVILAFSFFVWSCICRLSWQPLSFQNLVLKGHAFGIVLLEPRFRGVGIREDLEVIRVANRLACVDVDKPSSQGRPVSLHFFGD
jgi:hypothetical protein